MAIASGEETFKLFVWV